MSKLRLVVPYAGRMFRSSIGEGCQALCFCLNKGYLEAGDLESLLRAIERMRLSGGDWQVFVDKIKLRRGGFVYRQRLYFNNLVYMLEACRVCGGEFRFADTFRIGINAVAGVADELKCIVWYASQWGETADEYLTNACKVQTYRMLKSRRVPNNIEGEVNDILRGKQGYLERAPFMIGRYNIRTHTSTVYVDVKVTDERMYVTDNLKDLTGYGYTTAVIESDRKAGVFKK